MLNKVAEDLKDKGNLCFKKQDFKAAATFYSQACSIDPNNSVYYSNMSMALIKLENWQEALEYCTQGLAKLSQNDGDSEKIRQKLNWRKGVILQNMPQKVAKKSKPVEILIQEVYNLPTEFERL